MRQDHVFMKGEGKAWLERNKDKLAKSTSETDPVIQAIETYGIGFKRVLEVGCADGWRLKAMERDYDCFVRGLDPGQEIGKSASIFKGTAVDLDYFLEPFDLIIYGWCLYLCDPEDYFEIAREGDRHLRDGGFIIVYDFHAEHTYKTPYKHKEGLFSHHYDFSRLWLSHPAYHLYGRTIQGETSVTILQKNLETAFPVEK